MMKGSLLPSPRKIRNISVSSAPRALNALARLIENPKAKDHARGIAMVLDRTNPVEQLHTVKHEHDVTQNAMNTAQILQRIAELCSKFNIAAPPAEFAGTTIEGSVISQSGAAHE